MTTSSSFAHRRQLGFSLIEVLLMMGIVVMLAVSAFVIFPQVQASRQASILVNQWQAILKVLPEEADPSVLEQQMNRKLQSSVVGDKAQWNLENDGRGKWVSTLILQTNAIQEKGALGPLSRSAWSALSRRHRGGFFQFHQSHHELAGVEGQRDVLDLQGDALLANHVQERVGEHQLEAVQGLLPLCGIHVADLFGDRLEERGRVEVVVPSLLGISQPRSLRMLRYLVLESAQHPRQEGC